MKYASKFETKEEGAEGFMKRIYDAVFQSIDEKEIEWCLLSV